MRAPNPARIERALWHVVFLLVVLFALLVLVKGDNPCPSVASLDAERIFVPTRGPSARGTVETSASGIPVSTGACR